MSEQVINKPTPINEEIARDRIKTIINTTDRFDNITDVNQTFIDACGYSVSGLLGKPHNITRHPDIPKIVFKATWDNVLAGRDFHAIIKSLTRSGRYYWAIADFEVGRNIMNGVVTIMVRRRAVPQHVITDHIEPLYRTFLKLEKIGGTKLSNRYLKDFLERQGESYIEYVMNIFDDLKCEIRFGPVDTHTDTESTLGDYGISDDAFGEDHKEESILQHKSFFIKLFSTN